MKALSSLSSIMCLLFTVTCGAALAGPLHVGPPRSIVKIKKMDRQKKRQTFQKQRISQGVSQGQLTKSEVRRLVRQQRQIRKLKAKMVQNDGRVSQKEKRILAAKQNRASRSIYRARHNHKTRR